MFGCSRRELARQLERERLRNQQREAELLDRIMHLCERTWVLPPADLLDEADRFPDGRGGEVYVSAFDQLPEEL